MLLSNVSKTPTAASRVTKIKVPVYFSPRIHAPLSRSATSIVPDNLPNHPPQEVDALPLLVDAFVEGASTRKPNDDDKVPISNKREGSLHFLASVFANVANVSVSNLSTMTLIHFDTDTRRPFGPSQASWLPSRFSPLKDNLLH